GARSVLHRAGRARRVPDARLPAGDGPRSRLRDSAANVGGRRRRERRRAPRRLPALTAPPSRGGDLGCLGSPFGLPECFLVTTLRLRTLLTTCNRSFMEDSRR